MLLYMGALPIFAPDGVERALATQPGTIPQLAAARFGQPAKFTVAGGSAPFVSSIGNDESQNIVFNLTPQALGTFGQLFYQITCTMQFTNQSISYVGPNNVNGPDAFVAPNLISIDANDLNGGALSIDSGNPTGLINVLFPELTFVAGAISITNATGTILTRCEFPKLTTSAGLTVSKGVFLHVLSFPQYIPGNSEADDFSGNALNVASVNGILEQWALNTSFVGTLDLSGGSNAAPTGAGATAKAALITQGATVTTN